jgi:D-amino-acid N-acetyltransferase
MDDEHDWRALWEQYNDFYKRVIPDEVTRNTFASFLDKEIRMYSAVAVDSEENKIAGFVHWYPHRSTSSIEDVIYLQDLFVDPSVRGNGYGRQLIEHVFEHARVLPAKSVYWHTQHFNHQAQLSYVQLAEKTEFVHYRKTF